MAVEWTSLPDEIVDSTLRAIRWIVGGAAGGLVASWAIAGTSGLATVVGTVLLLFLSIFVDVVSKALIAGAESESHDR